MIAMYLLLGFVVGFVLGRATANKRFSPTDDAASTEVGHDRSGPLYGVFRVRVGSSIRYMVLPWHGWKEADDFPAWSPQDLYGHYEPQIRKWLGTSADQFRWWEFAQMRGTAGAIPPMNYSEALNVAESEAAPEPAIVVKTVETEVESLVA